MCFGKKKNIGDLPLGTNNVVNTVSISVHGNNKIISQFLPCCQPKVPSELVRSAKETAGTGNLQSVIGAAGVPEGQLNLAGACCLSHAAQRSRVQIPEAAPVWISNGTCWLQKGLTSMSGSNRRALALLHLHCEIC